MDLINEKLKYIDSYFQLVKFDLKGLIIDSTEEIKPLKETKNIFNEIPFVASIEEVLQNQKVNTDLSYHCIQSDFFGANDYYDFLFRKVDKNHIIWLICDFTDQYIRTIDIQQDRNLNSISKEKQKIAFEEDLKELQNQSESDNLFLKIDSLLVSFNINDIYYIEAYGDYIKLHTKDKTHISYAKLKSVEEVLPRNRFIRIHRSYIIQIDKIQTMNQQNVQINNKILPISLTYKDELLQKIRKLN